MQTVEFLRRVVPATGNFLTISWKGRTTKGMVVRSFPLANFGHTGAAGIAHWASSQLKADVFFALASYNVGEPGTTISGRPCTRALRKQENVHSLKAFAIDGDVAREGVSKSNAFADRRVALDWLRGFTQASGVPWPNLIVNSGWGYHWYWLFEPALSRDRWQPLADALSAALQKHGYIGDLQRTVDSASLLRPPETSNYKVAGQPKLVKVMQAEPDFALTDIEATLAPYVGLTRRVSRASPGPRPEHIPPIGEGANLNAAAHSGMEYPRRNFQRIADRCAQLAASLSKGGDGDPYPLWLEELNLTTFCDGGRAAAHLLSKGDPRYTEENVDKYFDQFTAEIKAKNLGAPLCDTFNRHRPGICQGCQYWGKIKTPVVLDVETSDDPNELPYNYQRSEGRQGPELQYYSGTNGEGEWKKLITGDVDTPRLDRLPVGGYQLSFIYEQGTRRRSVTFKGGEMTTAPSLVPLFDGQGISVDIDNARQVGKFVVAWINKLRIQQAERAYRVRAYGWSIDEDGQRAGVAVAGDHYKRDGTEEFVPGGDPKINAMYRPMGTYENWRKAAALFEGKRPDLQIPFGISLASALVALCGDVRGMSFNLFSPASGIGKTSSLKCAQAMWGAVSAMQTMADTPNAAMKLLSEPRILVRFWDEMAIRKGYEEQWVEMIFTIPQGKERARMQSDTTLRETGEWEAYLCMTSNRSYADILAASNGSSDSGQLRLLEIELIKQKVNFNPEAGPLIKLCESNYGHAGRMFLRYVTQNLGQVQDTLKRTMAGLSVKLKVRQEERYYLTAIATILVSAAIAKEMNLFDFDMRGIQRVLTDAFYKSRDTRVSTTVVQTSGDYDIETLIGEFQQELADVRLRTDILSHSGRRAPEIRTAPTRQEVHIQIAEQAALMRVSRKRFVTWLLARGLPANTIIKKLRQDPWNATEVKKTIGAGTAYAGGQIYCLDIPLVGALANYATDGMRQPEKRELPEGLRV